MVRRILLITLLLIAPTFGQIKKMLPKYEGRYYMIHTDLTDDDLKEAELRMSRMAEEYHERTKGFAGDIRQKLPFFLYRNEQDYYAAGGTRDSAGFFDPSNNTLNAIAGTDVGRGTWHTVQHEGFHQFAQAVIGGELPTWVNEGMAEYFGEGVFTGDGFVTGVIPHSRMERVKKEITGGQFKSVKDLMLLSHRDWNADLNVTNYDQAWSMVQFLAHGENGRYQQAFGNFMRSVGRGRPWTLSWQDQFGSAEGFEEKWKAYWLKLPNNPTADLYASAATQTLASVVGRASAARKPFASIEDVVAAMEKGGPKFAGDQWLPPSLLIGAADDVKNLQRIGNKFTLTPAAVGKLPSVQCFTKSGTNLVGTFTIRSGRVVDVKVTSTQRK